MKQPLPRSHDDLAGENAFKHKVELNFLGS
jgi:hypothetical protein